MTDEHYRRCRRSGRSDQTSHSQVRLSQARRAVTAIRALLILIATGGIAAAGLAVGGCEAAEQHTWLFPQEEFAREFRHLSDILESWRYEMLAQAYRWPYAALVGEGLQVLQALANPLPTDILLAADLHAANVLRSEREPWLVIDPTPFIEDAPL